MICFQFNFFVVFRSLNGKQLTIGMQGDDRLVTYSPTRTSAPSPAVHTLPVVAVARRSFHAIYASLGQLAPDTEQLHFYVSLDSKANSSQDIKLSTPYFPLFHLRSAGSFSYTEELGSVQGATFPFLCRQYVLRHWSLVP